MAQAPKPKSIINNKALDKKSLGLSWLAQIVGVVGFFMWSFSAIFAPMLFTGQANWQTQVLFAALIIMPVTNLVASLCLWIGYRKLKPRLWTIACIWLVISPLPLLLFN